MRYIKYFFYVVQHKWFYFLEGRRFIKTFSSDLSLDDKTMISKLKKSLWTHDWSKFSLTEFIPYANWFQSKLGSRYVETPFPHGNNDIHQEYKANFDKAWVHHYENNKHHWKFFSKLGNSRYEMPLIYIIEMIIDWSAMSRKFGDSPLKFFNLNKNKIQITKETKETLLYYLTEWDKKR